MLIMKNHSLALIWTTFVSQNEHTCWRISCVCPNLLSKITWHVNPTRPMRPHTWRFASVWIAIAPHHFLLNWNFGVIVLCYHANNRQIYRREYFSLKDVRKGYSMERESLSIFRKNSGDSVHWARATDLVAPCTFFIYPHWIHWFLCWMYEKYSGEVPSGLGFLSMLSNTGSIEMSLRSRWVHKPEKLQILLLWSCGILSRFFMSHRFRDRCEQCSCYFSNTQIGHVFFTWFYCTKAETECIAMLLVP